MLRQPQQSGWLNEPRHRACPWQRTPESLAASRAPAVTRRSLPPRLCTVVSLAADARRRRQFVVRAPGEQPGLHVLVSDIVACFDLAVRFSNRSQHSFLIGNVRLDGIRDQKVRTASRGLRQPRQAPFNLRPQADAQGGTACVRHEHMVTRAEQGAQQ